MAPAAAGVESKPRGKLSQASIDTITNLMYIATCDTNCKSLDTLKRFARACALLEQYYGSQEEYLNRNRQPEDLTERPRLHGVGLGLAGPRIFHASESLAPPPSVSSGPPLHAPCSTAPGFPFSPAFARVQAGSVVSPLTVSDIADSQPLDLAATPATAAAPTQSVAQCQTDADADADADADDCDADGSSSNGDDSDGDVSSSSSDDDASDDDGAGVYYDEDYHYDSVPPPAGRDVSNFNFAWNGPTPGKSKSKLSLRWPRKRQLQNMMKQHGWREMKAQWVDKHRRSGADPEMLRMYFTEKEAFKLRNGIVSPDQELNGDECLFRGEITEAMRGMKIIFCRSFAGMKQDQHAYATKGADADSFALVIFPVISANKCVFLQIILKGNPKALPNSKTGRKQAQLAEDVLSVLPAELASVSYCNFTKTGYQTAESFQDASRALLVALHLQENPHLLLRWSTPMQDIPPLRRRYMFKVDGSKTHCLNNHQFLAEITTRNLVMFPYTPNATAFVQELDQICLLLFKRRGRQIVKLELAAVGERPDFSNRFVSLVWAEDVAHAYKLQDVYARESQDNFAVVDNHHPSGHTGLTTYEISPDVCDIMREIANRVDAPWGPVRLASMLGHALGAALLNPTVLSASFDAVREERVFRRPLVVREIEFARHRSNLFQQRTRALSELAVSMAGNLVVPQFALAAELPEQMREASIPDEKWDMFCEHILRYADYDDEFREACAIYGSFSQMYDESRKSADKIEAFRALLSRAGSVAEHQAEAEAVAADARSRVVEAFRVWMEARVDSLSDSRSKINDVRSVLLPNYIAMLSAGLASIPAVGAARKALSSFVVQLNRITKCGEKVSKELQLLHVSIQSLQQKVLSQKGAKFPHASCPAPADATSAFDEASQRLLGEILALQVALQQEVAREASFDDVRQRAAAPPAPARGVPGALARGGGAGRGRGRRRGEIAAASTPTSSETSPEAAAAPAAGVSGVRAQGGAVRGRGGQAASTSNFSISPETPPVSPGAAGSAAAAADAAVIAFHNARLAQAQAQAARSQGKSQ